MWEQTDRETDKQTDTQNFGRFRRDKRCQIKATLRVAKIQNVFLAEKREILNCPPWEGILKLKFPALPGRAILKFPSRGVELAYEFSL